MNCLEKNNIPAGYKDSAVGVIPQEWEVKRLRNIAKCFSGGTPKSESEEMYGGTIPFIRSGEIHSNKTALFLTDDGLRQSSAKMVDVGDLIFALYGANSGDCAISQINGAINQAILCIRSSSVINTFLHPYLELQKDRYIAKYLQGGQGNLSGEIVCSYTIPVPPMEEQRKIAEILGVWDEAIEKQSRLIEKLELRKRALMQRLLTGRTRLPGFTTPWQKVKLGEIAQIKKGKSLTSNDVKCGSYPVIAGGKESPYSHSEYTDEKVITVSASGAYAGYISYHPHRIWASDCSVIKEIDATSSILFLYNLLLYKQDYIYFLQVGGAQPHVFPKDIERIKLFCPPLTEQKAIAEVLTTADDEIATHRKKLDALRLQKRGLMQQLLTGKTRVKI